MIVRQSHNEEERVSIRKKVIEHNLTRLPEEVKHPVKSPGFMLWNERGDLMGGITGTIFWYHLHIDFLWVDESLRGRGYGKELLDRIEEAAMESKCRLIQLDTFSFQAPNFYQAHGYEVVGIIEEHPVDGSRQYYLKKVLGK